DTGILGDVDGNEKINSLDSTLLFQYVSGAIDLVELKSQVLDPDNVEWRSDINGDTKINSIDSTLLFQYVSGASSSVTGD
ncbi:MAG: dockerin type I repeat-containing protein, partial [Lachnospirales bacterium]